MLIGMGPDESLGFDVVRVGDVDGDGITDHPVTSAWSGFNGRRSGRVCNLAGARQIQP